MATVAVAVCRAAGAPPRAYEKQAGALLRFVQERVYYVNEPGERLQDPFYTLKVGYGDCDDMALLLAALAESMRLPWRLAISGSAPGGRPRMVRWTEGEPYPSGVKWAHIYVRLGWPAFQPTTWVSAEPTIKGVPLGWDVVDVHKKHGKVVLPELAGVNLAGPDVASVAAPVAAPVAPLPFWEHVARDIKGKLHPRALIPAVVVGLVNGGHQRDLFQESPQGWLVGAGGVLGGHAHQLLKVVQAPQTGLGRAIGQQGLAQAGVLDGPLHHAIGR